MSEKSRKEILKRNKEKKKFSHYSQEKNNVNQKPQKEDHSHEDRELCANEIQLRIWVKLVNSSKSSAEASYAYDNIEKKFEKYISSKTSKYFLKGGDSEDIKQEGRIGLYKAVRDFDDMKGMSFVGFACMCIERHLVSTIKRGLRNKIEILNDSQSLDQQVYLGDDGDDDTTWLDIICDEENLSPEEHIVKREQHSSIKKRLFDRLTALEESVADLYLRGYSYNNMADSLDILPKSVDNAMSRVKDKAEGINIDDLRGD